MIRIRQITMDDLESVATLLAEGFPRRTRSNWEEALVRLGRHEAPANFSQFGYLLQVQEKIVGVLLLITSAIDAQSSSIRCNFSSWYVAKAYRCYAPLLVSRALAVKNAPVTYLNVSPERHTLPILEAQGFSRYSSGQFVIAPLPSSRRSRRRVNVFQVTHSAKIRTDLPEYELLVQHAKYGCISLWCEHEEQAFPFVFRPRIVKGFLPCVQLVYCRSMDEFSRFAWPIARSLSSRCKPIILADSNGPIPGLSGKYFPGVTPKYFKGPLRPRLGDLAYTEIAMFGL